MSFYRFLGLMMLDGVHAHFILLFSFIFAKAYRAVIVLHCIQVHFSANSFHFPVTAS